MVYVAIILYCSSILGLGQPALIIIINYGMNHAPGTGPIARPIDLQSSTLPLHLVCPYSI